MQITHELEEVFQQKIKYPKDCNALAKDIVSITNRNISSSTIRRLFGLLDSKSKISAYNLETLAFYINEKKRLAEKLTISNLSLKKDQAEHDYEQLKKNSNGLNEKLIKSIINSHLHPHQVLKLLNVGILEAIKAENIEFFVLLYQQDRMVLSNVHLFRFIGFYLNKNAHFRDKLLPILAKDQNARKYLFELFVDFGNFKSFRNWLYIYYQSEPNYLNKLWALSLIIFGNKLSQINKDHWDDFFELYEDCKEEIDNAHPYLKARVFGIGLISDKKDMFENRITQELNENKIAISVDKSFYPLFATMLFQYILIFSVSKNILKSTFEVIKSYNNKSSWRKEGDFRFYTLLIKTIINNGELGLNEIKVFDSAHTSEDVHVKLFALGFVKDEKLQSEVKKYRKQLTAASGFTYFEDQVN